MRTRQLAAVCTLLLLAACRERGDGAPSWGPVDVPDVSTTPAASPTATPVGLPNAFRFESVSPAWISLHRGGAESVAVSIDRGGTTGPITLGFDFLPDGVSAAPAIIPAGSATATLQLVADPSAPTSAGGTLTRVRGTVDGTAVESDEVGIRVFPEALVSTDGDMTVELFEPWPGPTLVEDSRIAWLSLAPFRTSLRALTPSGGADTTFAGGSAVDLPDADGGEYAALGLDTAGRYVAWKAPGTVPDGYAIAADGSVSIATTGDRTGAVARNIGALDVPDGSGGVYRITRVLPDDGSTSTVSVCHVLADGSDDTAFAPATGGVHVLKFDAHNAPLGAGVQANDLVVAIGSRGSGSIGGSIRAFPEYRLVWIPLD